MKENPPPAGQPPAEARPTPPQLDLPALADALQVAPARRTDVHFGTGYAFALGDAGETQLELYRSAVRVSMGDRQVALPRSEAQISNEGVVFEDEHGLLSVGAAGDVLFQYTPSSPPASAELPAEPTTQPQAETPPLSREGKPKVKSERHVGELGQVFTHTTKTGKFVAEVELAIPDPQRPGQKLFVKFAAFNDMAQELITNYRPGDEVTAVGVPHELQRSNGKGHHWTERQLYLVRPPKRTTS